MSKLDQKTFEKFLTDLHKPFEAHQREWVVVMGKSSMDRFHFEMEKRNNLDYVDFLLERGLVTPDQATTLKDMINSEDHENYVLAGMILNQKRDELGETNQQLTKPLIDVRHIPIPEP